MPSCTSIRFQRTQDVAARVHLLESGSAIQSKIVPEDVVSCVFLAPRVQDMYGHSPKQSTDVLDQSVSYSSRHLFIWHFVFRQVLQI